jgi:hypothetical protein
LIPFGIFRRCCCCCCCRRWSILDGWCWHSGSKRFGGFGWSTVSRRYSSSCSWFESRRCSRFWCNCCRIRNAILSNFNIGTSYVNNLCLNNSNSQLYWNYLSTTEKMLLRPASNLFSSIRTFTPVVASNIAPLQDALVTCQTLW